MPLFSGPITQTMAPYWGGGGETRGENQHKKEWWHNPQSREGGRCQAENAYQKRKHTVLCYCVSSQLTLATPRLGAEEGVGRTTTKNEHENVQSRASV